VFFDNICESRCEFSWKKVPRVVRCAIDRSQVSESRFLGILASEFSHIFSRRTRGRRSGRWNIWVLACVSAGIHMCGSRAAVLGRLIVCCTVLHQDLVLPSSCCPLPLPSSTSNKHPTPNLGSSIVMDAIISRVLANLRLPLRLGQRREDHCVRKFCVIWPHTDGRGQAFDHQQSRQLGPIPQNPE